MLKFLMLTLVFLLCAGCGAVYVLDLSARRRQIGQMLNLIRYLRREIRCSYAPLHQLLSDVPGAETLPLLREMDLSEPFDLSSSYEKAKRSCKGEIFFSEGEWDAADNLFYTLGKGDGAEQEDRLSLAESIFVDAEQAVRDLMGRNGKPAIVLGCSAGAVLILMLL